MWLKVISPSLSSFALGMAVANFIWWRFEMKESKRQREMLDAELEAINKLAQERSDRWQRIYNQIDRCHHDGDDRQDV